MGHPHKAAPRDAADKEPLCAGVVYKLNESAISTQHHSSGMQLLRDGGGYRLVSGCEGTKLCPSSSQSPWGQKGGSRAAQSSETAAHSPRLTSNLKYHRQPQFGKGEEKPGTGAGSSTWCCNADPRAEHPPVTPHWCHVSQHRQQPRVGLLNPPWGEVFGAVW